MVRVQRAWVGLGRMSATIAPEADATMVGTMGRSQVAVMVGREEVWEDIIAKGMKREIERAIMTSIHQRVHAWFCY